VPDTEEEYLEMVRFVNVECQGFIERTKEHYVIC
jgi:hypothetical protein